MATTETKEVTSLTQNMSEKINEIIPTIFLFIISRFRDYFQANIL